AFEGKDLAAAVRHYEQAEALTTDPGLIAFNNAAALYQLALGSKVQHEKTGLFRRAEEHYRCAADDPAEPRRLLARFGLANSLLQGRSEEIAAVRRAISCYRDCLKTDTLDESLTADARHNLEVAKGTLARLLERPPPDKPPQEQGDERKNPPRKEPDPKNQGGIGDPTTGATDPQPMGDPAEAKNGPKPIPTKRPEAGPGNVQSINDEMPTP